MSEDQPVENDPAKIAPMSPAGPVFSRRKFFTRVLPFAAASVAGSFYAYNVEPFWPRFHEFPIRIKGLPKSFENFRIAHITDMHTGHTPLNYLQGVMHRIEALKARCGCRYWGPSPSHFQMD